MHVRFAAFLLLLAVDFGGALAQEAAPPRPADATPIIVEGSHSREEQITSFIRELTPAPIRGQLSRFEMPVCPKVNGLSDSQARTIEARIRLVANAVGAPVASPRCTPNLVIFVTDDKPGLLHRLAEHPGTFPDEWSGATQRKFEEDPSPVAAWQIEDQVWQDGAPVGASDRAAPVTRMPPSSGGKDVSGHTFASSHAIATRLKPSARPTFGKAILVVSFDALYGLSATQLADYAAMRTLVRTDPKQLATSSQKTILGIFDAPAGAMVPPSLTAWDFSFLKAFYSSSQNNYAEYQRSQMRGLMERELDKQQSAQR